MRLRVRCWSATVLLAMVFLLVGCREAPIFNQSLPMSSESLPKRPPDEEGVIKRTRDDQNGQQGDGPSRSILVEGKQKLPTGDPNLTWVTLHSESKVLVEAEGVLRDAKASDIRSGQKVKIWFSGVVLTSNPAQAGGQFVVIQK